MKLIYEKVGWFEVTLRWSARTCSNFAGGLAPDFEVFYVPLSLSLSLPLSSFSIAQSQSRITRNVMRREGVSQGRGGEGRGGRTNAESNYIRRRTSDGAENWTIARDL